MDTITFVTGNKVKLQEAQRFISIENVKVVGEKLELLEIQSLNQKEVVSHKARQAFNALNKPVLVDDTGFYIDAYSGFPGTLTKYVNSSLGIEGLTKLYEEGQVGHFLTLVCFFNGEKEVMAEGILNGKLTKKISPNFNPDTPISSIFIPEGFDKTLIDLAQQGVSNQHRINAFINLKKELSSLWEQN